MVNVMDAFFSWVLDKAPFIGVVIAVSVIVWFVSRYFMRLEEARRKVDGLPCDEHRRRMEKLQEEYYRNADAVNASLANIGDQVTEISRWIMKNDKSMIDPLTRKCSPRQLTKMGRELFEISGAKAAMEENAEYLLGEMEKRQPPTPYDVEDEASKVLFGNLSHPLFRRVKDYLYYGPETVELTDEDGKRHEITLAMFSIVQLMTIDLRDRYLARHPEIK